MKGLISDIQKFSLHDGPGIRTTVFLKGCNMRCIWCHNPESLDPRMQIAFYPDKCIGCGRCFAACPHHAMRLENNAHVYDRSACARCGACAAGCPSGALTVIGVWREANDVFAELAADIPYYGDSGGVTLSGGEPLLQDRFCAELLQRCHEAGMDTAIETNLSLPFDRLERLLPWLTRIFFDVKIMDSASHRRDTGIENEKVLENARRLDRAGIPFVIHTPLIPGHTDSEENIRAIARWARGLRNLQYYELLNYNILAKAKYEPVGLTFRLPDAKPLPEDRVEHLVRVAQETGTISRFRKE